MTWSAPRIPWTPMAFLEAIRFLERRTPGFAPAREAAEAGAASEAFWIADVSALSVIERVYDSVITAVALGTPMSEWRETVTTSLRAEYPARISDRQVDARINLIFRNNAQRAYAEGRYEQAQEPAVLAARPFFMFDAILDDRTTDECRALNGVIRPQGDPLWDTQSPPRHMACRSGLRTLSRRQVEARGGVTQTVDVEPAAPGFGQRPGTAPPYRPPAGRYPPELDAAMRERAAERGAT